MVRREVASARIARATAWLQDAEDIFSRDAAAFVAADAGSTFDVLADRGAIERVLADQLREGVGLRNRITHGYALLDYTRVQSEAMRGIPAMRTFLGAVGREAGL